MLNVPQHTLYDTRDGNSYVVRKLADGKCWMAQNLRLINYTLKPEDSDVTSNWTLPNTTSGTSFNTAYVYVHSTYGGYYSWYAATAGTGKYNTTGNASNSICPKGWKLPTSKTNGAFSILYSKYSSYLSMTTMPGPQFSIGGFRSGSSIVQSAIGDYWSSTDFGDGGDYATHLRLNSSSGYVNPSDGSEKYRGLNVRCVAN